MTYFISAGLAIIFSFALSIYDKYYKGESLKRSILDFFKTSNRLLYILMPVYILASITGNYLHLRIGLDYITFLRWLLLIYMLIYISIIDCKERIIPNKLLLFLLVVRIIILIYEVSQNISLWKMVTWIPTLGMLIGGLTIFLGMLISRKGVGGGDVKMYAIIGLYVGSYSILGTLFYSFLFSALYGIYLLVFKRAKIRDSIPMAPFALLGVITSYGILYIGG